MCAESHLLGVWGPYVPISLSITMVVSTMVWLLEVHQYSDGLQQ